MLALIIFYETRGDNPRKCFRVLSCVIDIIFNNFVCVYYLACLSKTLSKISVDSRGGSKHGDKSFDIILGIVILYLLMNLMLDVGIIFLNRFTILEYNANNFGKTYE